MADLKKFANIQTIGIPNAPVQQFAEDKSDAIRTQGASQLVGSLVEAGGQAFQAVDTAVTNKRVRELVGTGDDQIPGMVEDPSQLTGEEASFLNFRQIAEARGRGLSADRARVAASTRLQQAIARDPRRADIYKRAFNNFFSGTGTFQQTRPEEVQEQVINYGLTKFGIDPRLAMTNPQAWERKFQANMTLQEQQRAAEARLTAAEQGNKLSQLEQENTFPRIVSSFLTNSESNFYVPSVVDSILSDFSSEDGQFNANNAVEAERRLKIQLNGIEAQLREQFPNLSSGEFESKFEPIQDYFDNAIAVANGEMTQAALERQTSMFRESAEIALYQGDESAARQWVGLTQLIGDLEVVPPSIQLRQEELGRRLVNVMPALTDPSNPTSAWDVVGEDGYGDVNDTLSTVTRAAARANASTDAPTRKSIADGITWTANEINSNPEEIKSSTYLNYFSSLMNDNVLDSLSPEQREAVEESLVGPSGQTFLNETLREWQNGATEGVDIVYNPDSKKITARVSPDAASPELERTVVRRLNKKLGKTNLYFQVLDKVAGADSTDAIANTELGRGILALSGIDISSEQPEIDFSDLPKSNPHRTRMAIISDRINQGRASERDVAIFNRVLREFPDMIDANIPELQRAIESVNSGELTAEEMAIEPTEDQIVPPANVSGSTMRENITNILVEENIPASDIEAFFDGTAGDEVNNRIREILRDQ